MPASPIRLVSSASTNIWISSAEGSNANAPLFMSSITDNSPLSISAASFWEIIPWRASIRACTILPFMSCSYIRQSKRMDELKSFTL